MNPNPKDTIWTGVIILVVALQFGLMLYLLFSPV